MENKIFDGLKAVPAACTDWKQVNEQASLNREAWESAAEFLKSDLENVSAGKHELRGGAYASVQEYETKDTNKWEYHENFIDIQFIAKGKEQIGIAPRENLLSPMGGYNDQKDIALFESVSSCTMVTMSPDGYFTILFPNEAHCPCLKAETNGNVKKVVVKIPFIKK